MDLIEFLTRKKPASMIENLLVMMINMVLLCAFLVIILGAFAGISDKWQMRQVAREYMLFMETEGFLNSEDQAAMIAELEACGLYDIDVSGTTVSEVEYGDRIFLNNQAQNHCEAIGGGNGSFVKEKTWLWRYGLCGDVCNSFDYGGGQSLSCTGGKAYDPPAACG